MAIGVASEDMSKKRPNFFFFGFSSEAESVLDLDDLDLDLDFDPELDLDLEDWLTLSMSYLAICSLASLFCLSARVGSTTVGSVRVRSESESLSCLYLWLKCLSE